MFYVFPPGEKKKLEPMHNLKMNLLDVMVNNTLKINDKIFLPAKFGKLLLKIRVKAQT